MLTSILNNKGLMMLISGSLLLLSGCVTIPDAIKGTTSTPVEKLLVVQNAPKQFTRAEARFGGTVVGVANESGRTVLEIAAMPLDTGARPLLGEPSQGRVLAAIDGFLDPVDFKGQLVTVVGPITGVQEGKIGMTPYRFVTMNVIGFKRWHVTQQIVIPPQPMAPWGWHHRPWGPDYGWYSLGPAQVQTVVTE